MSREQKKFQKRKQRERKVARKLQLQRIHKQYTDNYPIFLYESKKTEAPELFVKAIKAATSRIRFDDPELFTPAMQDAYRYVKKQDHDFVENWLETSKGDIEKIQSITAYLMQVGNIVFDMIGEEELAKWLPFCDVRFAPLAGDFVVQFRSLKQKYTAGGTTYYSSKIPKMVVDGKSKIIGFSTHAIQQICNRAVPAWCTYAGMGDAFAIFEQCNHYELATLVNESHALALYDSCLPGFFSWNYVTEILGDDVKTEGNYYHRIGYCPAVVEDEFLKAKTMLCPGYHGTPEYDRMMCSRSLSSQERTKMQEQLHEFDGKSLRDSKDFRILKWFHDNGVPQVVWSEENWYA